MITHTAVCCIFSICTKTYTLLLCLYFWLTTFYNFNCFYCFGWNCVHLLTHFIYIELLNYVYNSYNKPVLIIKPQNITMICSKIISTSLLLLVNQWKCTGLIGWWLNYRDIVTHLSNPIVNSFIVKQSLRFSRSLSSHAMLCVEHGRVTWFDIWYRNKQHYIRQ